MIEVLIYGGVTSAVYAMLAVGFTLVFGVARVLNLAHGAFYGLGAYAVYAMTSVGHWPLLPASIAAIILVGLFGYYMDIFLVKPIRKSALGVMIVTLAVSLLFEQSVHLIFGSEARNVPAFIERTFPLGGIGVSGQRMLTLVAGVVLVGGLWIYMQYSKHGSAILAISLDSMGARYMGIPADKVYATVMGVSAAMAAAAGILTAPFLSVQPNMYHLPLVKAFSIVIVGGMGSIPGSIVAAILLGYSETIVAYAISSAWTELVSLTAVLLTLIFRPTGLFGKKSHH